MVLTTMKPCTSGKDGLHKASFSHCSFEAVGGTSHGCEVCFPKWISHWRDLHEKPEGFVSNPSFVCRLKKSLYGLKQAPRANWYTKIDSFLLSLSFVQWIYDPNFYLKLIHGSLMIIFLYVNDLFIIGSSKKQIASLKDAMNHAFSMTIWGCWANS